MIIARWIALSLAALLLACSPPAPKDEDALPLPGADAGPEDEGNEGEGEESGGGEENGEGESNFSGERAAGDGRYLRFVPQVIVDATGFERPMAASTLFVPHGWQTQGGVYWGQEHLCTNGYNFQWTAYSPDGSMSVSVLPQAKWESNNYGAPANTPGCPLAPIASLGAYLEAAIQGMQPGAQILGFVPREDLAQQFSSYNQVTPMPMGEARAWVEAGEMRYAFTANGRAMEGSYAAVVVFSLMRTDAGMGVMDALTGFVFPGFGATAPKGAFNPAFFEAIRRSIRTNPDWERRITGHNVAIGRVALEESRKRAAMINESNAEIARIRDEAWSNMQESADRRAREFGELMKGVETYQDRDAAGGTVELSASYNDAWRLNDGTYILTNDPNFDPWRDLRVEGRRLDPIR